MHNMSCMDLVDIPSAEAQYTASLPWQASRAAAQSALDAVRYLAMFRAKELFDAGCKVTYETILTEKESLEKFLGATAPRAFGRTRRIGVHYAEAGVA